MEAAQLNALSLWVGLNLLLTLLLALNVVRNRFKAQGIPVTPSHWKKPCVHMATTRSTCPVFSSAWA